jgi:signal transduction histidine kinase/CheY-like chemotaxis protein/pSer/pThr/pTyr-binding forkhead associated (FHA) protein
MTRLYILSGPDKGQSFALKAGTTSMGRAVDNEIRIKGRHVSRHHLKITRKDKKFYIEDLNSTNGTFIDGKVIAPGREIELKERAQLGAGNVIFSLGKPYNDDLPRPEQQSGTKGGLGDTLEMERRTTPLRNLELIYKVSTVFVQTLDIDIILKKILDYIFDLLKRIDRGAIILVESDTGKIRDVISRSKGRQRRTYSTGIYSRMVVERVIKQGKAVIVSNTLEQDPKDRSKSMERMKIKSLMCVPLMTRSKIQGVIYVDSVSKPYGFRKEDLAVLTALSSPAAIAIENAMLYSNLEKMVEKRTKDLMETQEKLVESEARFKAIFDHMSSGVAVYEATPDGANFKLLSLNDAYRRMENVTGNHVYGKGLLDVFPHYGVTGISEVFQRVWRTGRPESSPLTFFRSEEPVGWRECYVYRLPSREIVTIIDDVTDKRKAEKEQRILQQQLFVSQKMESIGALAGGIAHNFRNILHAISGNTELLETVSDENDETKRLAKTIYDSVEKGVDLINSLLHFSRRGGEYRLVDLDLADVIRETLEVVGHVFSKGIQIESNVDKGLFVRGNRSLLSQVFMNLFNNASDAMPNGGKLVIEASRKGNKVIASVTDTGMGMDEETLEKIFDPFFTLKEVGKGTGLGLSTVHGIIEDHKGSTAVTSKAGKGSTFRIYLPYVEGALVEEHKAPREIKFGKGERVLIVDDEGPALDVLAAVTRKLGYEPIPVEKALEALSSYDRWHPDVVLMDRGMPDMDGVTCAKKIIEKDPEAKIIIVSGYEDTGPNGISNDVRKLIKGYITKPCNAAELSQMISKALGGEN